MFLLLQTQCSLNTRGFTVMIINLNSIICEEASIYTCNLFLRQAVVWFLMMHTL